jgi:hypothetical protein
MTEVYKKLDEYTTIVMRGFYKPSAAADVILIYPNADFTEGQTDGLMIVNRSELSKGWGYIDGIICFTLDKRFVSPSSNSGSKINIIIPDTEPHWFISFWNYAGSPAPNRVDYFHGITSRQLSTALEQMCALGYM